METYPNLIAEVCKTEKTIKNVSLAIPIMIRWAQTGVTTGTYADLIHEMGMTRFSGIGYVLGYIEDVLSKLREVTKKKIPTLNALVRGKTGLPSDGFSYVFSEYDSYPNDVKRALADKLNTDAVAFDKWDIVLQLLNLKPSTINSTKDEAIIRSGKHYGAGGEGEKHKALKEYVCAHPESVGIKDARPDGRKTEYILLSGDRLDVYFETDGGEKIAVEVKSIISPDDDILRGIYQCVKYKAVLDAESKAHGEFPSNRSLLVIEGTLSESNRQVKEALGINVIEHFNLK